jgi:hypothetical protein
VTVQTLLAALILVAFVGVLQVWLDRRARRAPKLDEFGLHIETTANGPVVCDDTGRRLRGIRLMRYKAGRDRVDTLFLEVLCQLEGRKYIAGRWTGTPRTFNPTLVPASTLARRIAERAREGRP